MNSKVAEILKLYQKKKFNLEYVKNIKSGKEASVYLVKDSQHEYALKVFHPDSKHSQGANNIYTANNYIRQRSMRKAVQKNTRVGQDYLAQEWTIREYKILKKLSNDNASVPAVYAYTETTILMEYLGDEENAAPRIYEIELTQEQAEKAFEEIISTVEKLLHYNTVHGDLSKFNILWWKDKPYVIDFPQSVNMKSNPNAYNLLKRDIDNVIIFFNQYMYVDILKIYEQFNLRQKTRTD